MRKPPDDDGAPRRHSAETPGNVVEIHPNRDLKWGASPAQEKIAGALAIDPWIGVHQRTLAVRAARRLRLGLPVPPAEARELRTAYEERRRQVSMLWQAYR